MKKNMRHIGRETPRILGSDIVTGKAMFVADNKVPGMKYGKVMHSPHPYAKILSIDKSAALALEGVKCVLTWEDMPENLSINNGFTPPRHPNIMDQYVRYVGDPVALVVADTEDIAMEAIDLIKVEYEVLKPVLTIEEALAEGAPQIYEEFPGNIVPNKLNLHYENGEVEKGFEEADIVIEKDVSLKSGQNPLPLEPPVHIAWWDKGVVTFISSAAAPAYCHQNVAASLNLPYENVRLIVNAVGGSFGSKLYSGIVNPLVLAALMAKGANCPVLYAYTKEEHFAAHQTRMITKGHVKLGLKKDGTVTAVDMKQWSDAGSTAATQPFMLSVGTNSITHLTKTMNIRFNAEVVITNHVPSGSFRGYGYLESTNLLTSAICDACSDLGIDPMDYFEKNALGVGEEFYNACAPQHPLQVNNTSDWKNLVRETRKACDWDSKWQGWGKPTWVSKDGKKFRGLGVAAAGHCDTGGKQSNATVTVTGLGAVYVSTCMSEFGAGTRDIMHKIVAEELDVPLEQVKMSPVDTGANPADFGSTGSRSTYCGGIVALKAAQDVKRKILEAASQRNNIPVEDLEFTGGVVRQISNKDNVMPLFPCVMGKVDSFTGVGHHGGVEDSTIFHLQVVEVEVDKELGSVKVINHFSGSDAGVIINPLAAKNQMQAFYAGVDLGLMEETIWDPNDYRVLNPSNIEYKTRTFNDMVNHDHIILETNKGKDTRYPFGANGLGEPMIAPGGPAIRMAVYNAIGVWVDEFPLTPNRVIAAIKEKEGK